MLRLFLFIFHSFIQAYSSLRYLNESILRSLLCDFIFSFSKSSFLFYVIITLSSLFQLKNINLINSMGICSSRSSRSASKAAKTPNSNTKPSTNPVSKATPPQSSSSTTANTSSNANGKSSNDGESKGYAHGDHQPGSMAEFKARYQLKQVVGNGNYSVVREAVDKTNGDQVAVKCIDRKKLSKEDEDALKIETGILDEIKHPNIISLYGFYDDPKNYYIVTEFMQGGELFDRIVKKEFYSEEDAQKVVRTLGSAIKYCHDRGIAHRDLKPENILMKDQKDDAAIKIADFGFARKEKDGLKTACGTPGYVAPEIINNEPYDRAVDMWSLGVIIYILLCGYPPFYNQNQTQLFQQIRKGQFEFDSPYWDPVSESAKDLIRGLLTVDKKKRLTIDQLLAHPWVTSAANGESLIQAITEMKKFNARRKLRAGIKALVAAHKFKSVLTKLAEASVEVKKQQQAEAQAEAAAKNAAT